MSLACPVLPSCFRKAHKRGTRAPPEDDLPQQLQDAEQAMQNMEIGLFNSRAVPDELIGLGKYAVVYQDILSQRFWDALAVRSSFCLRHVADPLGAEQPCTLVAVTLG